MKSRNRFPHTATFSAVETLGNGYVITTVGALFAVMGVLTLPPVFIAATEGYGEAEKRKVAYQTALSVAITMLVSFFIGSYILELFKINMDAFKLAGALVVANMAWGMIIARPSPMLDTQGKNPAVIPLAIPKTAGPGAIATVIALGQTHTAAAITANVLAIVGITALALLFMLASGRIEKTLGESGLNIVNRVFGLILLAIALTSVLASLINYFPGWASA